MSFKIGKIASEIIRFVLCRETLWVIYGSFMELKILSVIWMDDKSAL